MVYMCNTNKFNEKISPYLSSIFGRREIDIRKGEIKYYPIKNQDSGTMAIVKNIVQIENKEGIKISNKVEIDFINHKREGKLIALLKD